MAGKNDTFVNENIDIFDVLRNDVDTVFKAIIQDKENDGDDIEVINNRIKNIQEAFGPLDMIELYHEFSLGRSVQREDWISPYKVVEDYNYDFYISLAYDFMHKLECILEREKNSIKLVERGCFDEAVIHHILKGGKKS